ncbi:purine and uridine phosphorylase [Tilletiaria anomala UBC 951]|uniref:Purine and uridine phosphorylase n=1 Tax=Tilletiaria anomala (strain ATCC 24038 / CBS 436.72 / UBC 951) TaxID=1037660 RepID=A0A066WNQ0_TILAU|nr:purine and uridine phosphorylase [Tilletiaria anomala UBC 951]KDN52240.1 purine and uridine phosphorylase [Tilletiaria anomala UBC 951]
MKEVLLDANFPRDAEGRTYHVGTKAGQVANRIITVGDHVRAHRIASQFDGGKALFEHNSQRNFLTLTGTFDGVPITVVAIGMGFPVVDFFIRECRAVVQGDMIVVRLGSCGSLNPTLPIGTVVVPFTSFGITRNYDYFHPTTTAEQRASDSIEPYNISQPLDCDREVHDTLLKALEEQTPEVKDGFFHGAKAKVQGNVMNASADSFYGSQGRQDAAFLDANTNLIEVLEQRHPGISTLEMETFLINHLALCANNVSAEPEAPKIKTGAVQMIFANRTTSAFITPDEVELLERWAGRSVCAALASLSIPANKTHPHGVWSKS